MSPQPSSSPALGRTLARHPVQCAPMAEHSEVRRRSRCRSCTSSVKESTVLKPASKGGEILRAECGEYHRSQVRGRDACARRGGRGQAESGFRDERSVGLLVIRGGWCPQGAEKASEPRAPLQISRARRRRGPAAPRGRSAGGRCFGHCGFRARSQDPDRHA